MKGSNSFESKSPLKWKDLWTNAGLYKLRVLRILFQVICKFQWMRVNLFLEGTCILQYNPSLYYTSFPLTSYNTSLKQHNYRCYIKVISFLRWEVNTFMAYPLLTINIIFSHTFKINPIYTMFCICLSGSIKIIIWLRILIFFY